MRPRADPEGMRDAGDGGAGRRPDMHRGHAPVCGGNRTAWNGARQGLRGNSCSKTKHIEKRCRQEIVQNTSSVRLGATEHTVMPGIPGVAVFLSAWHALVRKAGIRQQHHATEKSEIKSI